MKDKYVWVKWMELRVNGDVDAVRTPTGFVPKYDDIVPLFWHVLSQGYPREDYEKQFMLRVPESLAKIERIEHTYRTQVPDAPSVLFDVLDAQRLRLLAAAKEFGEYISPFSFK